MLQSVTWSVDETARILRGKKGDRAYTLVFMGISCHLVLF